MIVLGRRRFITNLYSPGTLKVTLRMNAVLLLSLSLSAADPPTPKEMPLWPRGAPGARGDEPADRPTLTLYRPPADKATGAAVVVCPGGGYRILAVGHEGKDIAEWLTNQGITAFVLKYRIAPRYRHSAPLQDA